MSETQNRLAGVLRGLVEPALALGLAFALTGLMTLPFLPTREQLETGLRPDVAATVTPHEQLTEQVEALGLAEDVRVLLVRGSSRLVLEGVDDPDRAEVHVGNLLRRSGYQSDDWVRRDVVHVEGLLRGEPRTLPLVMSIQAAVFLAVGYLLARRRLESSTPDKRMSRARAALWGVGAGVATVVMSAIMVQLLRLVGLPVEEQPWLVEMYSDRSRLMRIAPWVVLIAPISEEVFFRLYAFRFIAAHAGFPAGLVVSSLMFALIHLNFSGLLIYLGIGCVLAWVYHRTGRLTAPILGHVTLNAIVLITSSLGAQLDL